MHELSRSGSLGGSAGPAGNLDVEVGDVGRQLHVYWELLPPRGEDQPVDLGGRIAWGEPNVRGGDVCVGIEKVIIGPIGHCVMHPQATVDRPERYRSSNADDRDVLAIGAADTVDRAQRAHAVRHQ
jgi:hypothetical protein